MCLPWLLGHSDKWFIQLLKLLGCFVYLLYCSILYTFISFVPGFGSFQSGMPIFFLSLYSKVEGWRWDRRQYSWKWPHYSMYLACKIKNALKYGLWGFNSDHLEIQGKNDDWKNRNGRIGRPSIAWSYSCTWGHACGPVEY